MGWDGATAHGADTPFPWLMRHVDGRLSVWSDTACHAAAGDPAARTRWPRGAWEDRRLVATVRSMLTVVCHLHKTPCGRTRRGDRLGPSPQLSIRANCLNLNQKKCKFLLCCRYCQAPFTHFFLLSLLPLKAYPIGNIFIAQMFTSAHMSIHCGLPGAAKVRYDPYHHPGLNTRCFRSQGLV